jgi:hypothetical protein
MRSSLILCAAVLAAGCTQPVRPCAPQVVEIERVERVPVPAECLQPCAEPAGVPGTNGELLEAYAARGEALACYRARVECVEAVTGP